MENKKLDYKNYFLGGIAGAVIGVVAAYLIEKAESLDEEGWKSTRKKISGIGMKTIAMLWSLTDHGKGPQ